MAKNEFEEGLELETEAGESEGELEDEEGLGEIEEDESGLDY